MNTFHRFFVTGLLTGLSLVCASTVLADDMYQQQQYQQQPYQQQQPRQRSYGEKVGKKALNGVTNIGTSWLEVPKGIINNTNAQNSNIFYGLVGGALEGALNTAARATIGVSDLILAPLPTKAIIQPQYIWEDFYETNTMYGDIFRLDDDEKPPVFELPHQD